jgi:hypothetical protein
LIPCAFWAKDASIVLRIINAKAETITTAPYFLEAIKHRRSRLRIESTRISQMSCFASVFLLSHCRLRKFALDLDVRGFVSVSANSKSLPKTTQCATRAIHAWLWKP